jgi:subtilisin family serine protease
MNKQQTQQAQGKGHDAEGHDAMGHDAMGHDMTKLENGSAGTRGIRGWRMPRAVAVAVAAGALLGILGLQGSPVWAQAGDTDPETPTFFYSNDKSEQAPEKREPLAPATDWVGVQLQPDASVAETEKDLKAKIQIDNGRATSEHKRARILVLPVPAGKARSTKQQLRAQRKALKGVRHVVRVFEHKMGPVIETDEFVIRFNGSVTEPQAAALLEQHGAVIVEPLGAFAPNGYLARVTDSERTSSTEVANALYSRPDVLYSHPNLISPVEKSATVNDPLFSSQWHLYNYGQWNGKPGADVKARNAWDITGGNPNIIVAVLDDGFDLNHQDLYGKWVQGADYVDGDWDPRPIRSNENHGTACAGVVAASGNNGVGVTGVAPYCRLMPLRIFDGTTLTTTIQPSAIANAFYYAAQNGASVISNSWIAAYQFPEVVNAINYAATSGRGGRGCVVVWAAGNYNQNCDNYPYQNLARVICVAASTNQDLKASYSNYGSIVDLCAPSSGGTAAITTTDRTGSVGYSTSNYTSTFGGTSSATPLVAGVAALVLSRNPNLYATQVHRLLRKTSEKINYAGGGYNSYGFSPYYGYGRINAWHAVYYATSSAHYN